MDTTTNLGLKKPELSERYNLAVWNDNSDTLDAFAGTVSTALAGKVTPEEVATAITAAIAALDAAETGGELKYIATISQENGVIVPVVGTIDAEPTSASKNPVRSGGVVNYCYGTAATTIPSGANLDTYVTPGAYRCTSNTIAASLYNCPTANGFRMEVMSTIASASTGYQIQKIYPNNTNGEFFMRRRGAASSDPDVPDPWSDWYKFQGTAVQPINTPAASTNALLQSIGPSGSPQDDESGETR